MRTYCICIYFMHFPMQKKVWMYWWARGQLTKVTSEWRGCRSCLHPTLKQEKSCSRWTDACFLLCSDAQFDGKKKSGMKLFQQGLSWATESWFVERDIAFLFLGWIFFLFFLLVKPSFSILFQGWFVLSENKGREKKYFKNEDSSLISKSERNKSNYWVWRSPQSAPWPF